MLHPKGNELEEADMESVPALVVVAIRDGEELEKAMNGLLERTVTIALEAPVPSTLVVALEVETMLVDMTA